MCPLCSEQNEGFQTLRRKIFKKRLQANEDNDVTAVCFLSKLWHYSCFLSLDHFELMFINKL